MTLASTPPIKDYIEDGATLNHAVPFQFNDATEIRCTRIPVGGVEGAELTLGADYNVTGGAGGTGTVVKTNAGTNGATFRIRRLSQESQQTKFSSTGSFPAANVEKALDHEMAVVQEIDVARSLLEQRAVRAQSGESLAVLPPPAQRASALMQWSGDGKTLLMTGVSALAALLAAPLALLSGAANKGDPGGNVMAIGLFAFAAALSVPAGTDVVRTSGYSVKGVGIADYVNDDATVNAGYVAANPRTSFISANGRGFKLVTRNGVRVEQVGAIGDNVADDGDALIAAHAGGGTVYYGDTTYKSSKAIPYVANTTVIGGRGKTKINFTNIGGGGANAAESTRLGSGFYSTFPINASTPANVNFSGIWVSSANGANVGSGFYDTGGTEVFFTHCRVGGFKYGFILDQTEVSHIDACVIESQTFGGIWLVNGSQLSPGALGGYTNQISITRCQINEGIGVYGIIDDGGVNHCFWSNNYNGCLNHIRAAGVTTLSIGGASQYESSGGACIVLSSNRLDGGGTGGCLTAIYGGTYAMTANNPAIHADAGPGSLQLGGGVSFSGGGGAAAIVTNAANFFLVQLGVLNNGSFGPLPLFDAAPNALVDLNKLGLGAPATAPGVGFLTATQLPLQVRASTTADGYVTTLSIDHGASGHVYLQSLLHNASGYAEFIVRTQGTDDMGERARFNETGLVLPATYGVFVGANKVLGARQGAIPNDASGAANQATVNAILAAMRAHGFIAP